MGGALARCACTSGFGVQGVGFRVWGSGFGVQGVGFRVWGSGFGVQGVGLMAFFPAAQSLSLPGSEPYTLNPKP